jgi:hypothetical protein
VSATSSRGDELANRRQATFQSFGDTDPSSEYLPTASYLQ